jgi:hypothetical protein
VASRSNIDDLREANISGVGMVSQHNQWATSANRENIQVL